MERSHAYLVGPGVGDSGVSFRAFLTAHAATSVPSYVTTVLLWLAGGVVVALGYRLFRSRVRRRFHAAAIRAIRQFEVRLERYKLVDRHRVRAELVADHTVRRAIAQHAATHHLDPARVQTTVERYVDEIVPFFNVLSYYKIGYNLSRLFLRLLYRVNVRFADETGLQSLPRNDVVVYVMNHRSNADYVVVAYVLAGRVSISYAVGEWARVWPLEYVFKSFGAYFVRRRYREPLYHTVLERYVQLITRNGVTQGIFLEGGLTRNGTLGPPKLGLLDYLVRTLEDPAFDRNIWLVPVAINYDRVLEDRTLIRERTDRADRPGRLRQFLSVARFLFNNLRRVFTGRLKRYGRVSVTFGSPESVNAWRERHPGVLLRPKRDRLAGLETFANHLMRSIGDLMPVTPVPLVASALLALAPHELTDAALAERVEHYRTHLIAAGREVEEGLETPDIIARAWLTFGMRHLVQRRGGLIAVPEHQRPLLDYYANSIRHLLPEPARVS